MKQSFIVGKDCFAAAKAFAALTGRAPLAMTAVWAKQVPLVSDRSLEFTGASAGRDLAICPAR